MTANTYRKLYQTSTGMWVTDGEGRRWCIAKKRTGDQSLPWLGKGGWYWCGRGIEVSTVPREGFTQTRVWVEARWVYTEPRIKSVDVIGIARAALLRIALTEEPRLLWVKEEP